MDEPNEVVIRRCERGYEVIVAGTTSGLLGMGELIEQILSLLPQVETQSPRYPMLTPEEWHAIYPNLPTTLSAPGAPK